VALHYRQAFKVRSLQSDNPEIVWARSHLIERVNKYQTKLIAASL
jgi:hypothetical protein